MADPIDYKSNSNKSKSQKDLDEAAATEEGADRKKLETIVMGQQRKKSVGRRFVSLFAGEDVGNVRDYVLKDVIVPAIKTTISDAVREGIDRMLFGETRRTGRPQMGSGVRTDYRSMSRPADDRRGGRSLSDQARRTHDFNEIVIDERAKAEEVIDSLMDALRQYGSVSVADLYDLVGITGSFTDDKWGWYDLRGASTRRVRDGWLLVLPATAVLE